MLETDWLKMIKNKDMPSTSNIPRAINAWSREALTVEKGARLLLLGDDSTGQGRRLYVSLRRQMQGKGLRVVDISPRGRTQGRDLFAPGPDRQVDLFIHRPLTRIHLTSREYWHLIYDGQDWRLSQSYPMAPEQ